MLVCDDYRPLGQLIEDLHYIRISERLLRAASPLLNRLLKEFNGRTSVMNTTFKKGKYRHIPSTDGKQTDKLLYIEAIFEISPRFDSDFPPGRFWTYVKIWANWIVGEDRFDLFPENFPNADLLYTALDFAVLLQICGEFERFLEAHKYTPGK